MYTHLAFTCLVSTHMPLGSGENLEASTFLHAGSQSHNKRLEKCSLMCSCSLQLQLIVPRCLAKCLWLSASALGGTVLCYCIASPAGNSG